MVEYAWPSGVETARNIRAEYGPRTLLAFSRGKDTIAAWIAIRDIFDEIVPIHRTLVPGLEIVEESLCYFERAFQTKIWRMIHPQFYNALRTFLFQTPRQANSLAGLWISTAYISREPRGQFSFPQIFAAGEARRRRDPAGQTTNGEF